MQALFTAIRFLTRVPLPGGGDLPSASDLRRATALFPLVGSAIGLSTAAVIWGASWLWPLPLAVMIGLAFEALLTGGLHEDAVADFFDAFGGGRSHEDILRILKDSRVGSYGALALVLLLLLRAGALASLERGLLFAALAASAGMGRWLAVIFMALLPPPRQAGLANDFGRRISLRELAAGTLGVAPAAAVMAWIRPFQSALALGALAVLALVFYHHLERRLGGATGDCLGCLCYLVQVVVLLAAAVEV